ncbi:MAG TPA: tetratricopeptide repeat protein, partial [Candidatus Polarisedimenticolia bacterium]|nr:tetratricopeptide repeat protein [Candidatus Polarisedimenticolia bacterium]
SAVTAASGPALALAATLVHGMVETPFDVPAITLTLVALVVPLLLPSGPCDAAMYVRIPWRPSASRRLGVALLIAVGSVAYVAGVARPFAAHRMFEQALARSRPGAPDPALDRAIELNPYNPLYRSERARIVWRADRPLDLPALASADADLSEAIRLDPGDPDLLANLARLHARACLDLGADPTAVQRVESFFRGAIALGRKDPRPHHELGVFLLAAGRTSEGLTALEEALAIEPMFLGARLSLARGLLDAGRGAEARETYRKFEESRRALSSYDPKNPYEQDLVRVSDSVVQEVQGLLGPAGSDP